MNRFKLLCLLTVAVLIVGCGSDDNPTPDRPEFKVEHTLFVYLGNLPTSVMESNINGMLNGLNASKPNGNVVIFYDKNGLDTELVELRPNSIGVYERSVLKSYGENLNSSDLKVFKLALKDLEEFTSSEGYSLILSSHGSGWVVGDMMMSGARPRSLRQEIVYKPNPLTRAIVDASGLGAGMDVHDVADALPVDMFDFVLFDACNMGCVEVVYAFKDRVDFIIASPSEVLIDGFPYFNIVGNMFDKSDVKGALTELCVKYFNYYKSGAGGCNIALYETSKVEGVASAFSLVVDRAFDNNIIPIATGLQWFDGPLYPHLMYDMQEFADTWIPDSDDLLVPLAASIDNMTIYSNTTETSQNGYDFFRSPVSSYCGVSVYIPQRLEYTNKYYRTTDWSKRVYGDNDITTLFNI